jgi:hypothetical protein
VRWGVATPNAFFFVRRTARRFSGFGKIRIRVKSTGTTVASKWKHPPSSKSQRVSPGTRVKIESVGWRTSRGKFRSAIVMQISSKLKQL